MAAVNSFSRITPEIEKLSQNCMEARIDPELYTQLNVNRGLRDINGKGVLTGLTEISEIVSSKMVDGVSVSCEGELYYRGINVIDLVNGFTNDNRFGFEETTYLLLFGKLPNKTELADFEKILSGYRNLPKNFVRDVIMKNLYAYDSNANDLSIPNVLRQSLELIALFPMLAVYSYRAKSYYIDKGSFFIHHPLPGKSTAENILQMLRPDNKYTQLEASTLDTALVLHAEHGGGNNSTFTTHVVTSSGTDTYASVVAALSSLKGPKHGGANIMVVKMMNEIKKNVSDWKDDEEISKYLQKILHKEAFDKAGVIYGMGHAVYSISDPRANTFKKFVQSLSKEKGRMEEFDLYTMVERIAPEVIAKERQIYKGVSANIDFYSGFVYNMLELPNELYTPLFAMGRIAGWSAHRLEELINAGKIIRPAYKAVSKHKPYVPMDER